MTKKEHVMQAVRHQSSDTVPYCIHLTGEAYDLYGDQLLKDYFNRDVMDDYKAGLLSKMQAVNLSIGNYMLPLDFPWWDWDYAHMPAAYGNADEVPEEMPGIVREDTPENFEKFYRKAAYISQKYQVFNTCLIFGSHWEKAYFTRGIENFLADIAGAPEFAQALLDYIIRINLEILPRLLKCNEVDGVLLGSDWGCQNDLIMSPQAWKQMIKAGEKAQYALIQAAGKKVMVHSCGCISRILDELVELGVDILNPVQPECMDLHRLKEQYGDALTFWGGISTQRTLPFGTPEEVKKETEDTIKRMSQNGGYITCSSQEIQVDVPYENLKMLIDTARSFT